MTLSSMVVSRDLQEVSVLECILGGLQMDVAIEAEPQRVLPRLSKSKFDALIVDCDLNGSSQLLRELRSPDWKPKTVPLVLMGHSRELDRLDENGALFAFTKPISVEQAVHTLSAARSMILDERLRYQRTSLNATVSLKCKGKAPSIAQLVNLSQNGMQIRIAGAADLVHPIHVTLNLPGDLPRDLAGSQVQPQAEIVWQDNAGNVGLRFVKVAPQHQKELEIWLAQRFFSN
jgi:DNA-binding NtrC family response regulator